MDNLIKLLIAFCLFGYGAMIRAQNTIPATGCNGAGISSTLSNTIGTVVFTTNTGAAGSMAQVVQQPLINAIISKTKKRINQLILKL